MEERNFYEAYNHQVSPDEWKLITHIKRFFECIFGDAEFFAAVQENISDCGHLLQAKGISGVDPTQLEVLFPEVFLVNAVSADDLAGKPQALLWRKYTEAIDNYRNWLRQQSEGTPSQRFNGWHKRQINRCYGQLGSATNEALVHPTIIFELSKGCSMGCPFCGLAAEPLQEVFMYSKENAEFWKEVLQVAIKHLGKTVGTGFCYWASEPSDNPDYFKFLEDFGRATGVYPQTTTAAPLRDLDWTRELLRFRQRHLTAPDRFSILSTSMLRRVHSLFSAEDLAVTSLILQHADTRVKLMANSGRNRKNEKGDTGPESIKNHTIACLTGYLVNMADGSVKLISPCPPTETWPLGYRIYAQGNFSDAGELDDFITQTVDKYMPEHLGADDIIAFRPDIEFIPLAEGFELHSEYQLHKMTGAPHLRLLGSLIAQGKLTSWKVTEELMAQYPDILAITGSIQSLFEQGLLDDGLNG